VRTVRVVVLDVFVQHCGEVAGSGDQEVVEALRRRVPMKRSAIALDNAVDCT
jgi:hypothetical protein